MNKNLTGRQGALNRKPLMVTPPVTARGIRVPDPRANFSPACPLLWAIQWTGRLHLICKSIERQRAAGRSVRKAARHCAWIWKSRSYRTAPHIKVRFGRATLVNRYYQWLRNGKSPNCFVLRYADRLAPVTPEDLRRFLRACRKAGTVSLTQAAKLAGLKRAEYCRIRVRLPRQMVDQVKGIFQERRKAELEARAAVRQFRGQKRLRRAAEGARGRKLERLSASLMAHRGVSGVDSTSRRLEGGIQATGGPLQANYKGVAHGS